jgi:transketolase
LKELTMSSVVANTYPTNAAWQDDVRRAALGVRRRVLALTIEKGGCYLSQACSSAEILSLLYRHIMKLGPSEGPFIAPKFYGTPSAGADAYRTGGLYNGAPAPDRDRFFLSPSHYCVALYAILVESGRLSPESMSDFNLDGGTLEMIGAEHSPGMELTTGSFGQALSQVAGIAAARRLRGESGNNWLMMSDGEFNEGQVWEALMFASNQRLDRIGVFVDVNGQQVDGLTRDVFNTEPLAEKLAAFGADVADLDGHDIEAMAAASRRVGHGKPLVVLCRTDPARGLGVIESRKPDLHYVTIRSDQERERFETALAELTAEYEKDI